MQKVVGCALERLLQQVSLLLLNAARQTILVESNTSRQHAQKLKS